MNFFTFENSQGTRAQKNDEKKGFLTFKFYQRRKILYQFLSTLGI